MDDQVLSILKVVLLAMLYLFFVRVLWAVQSEVRKPSDAKPQGGSGPTPPLAAAPGTADASAQTMRAPASGSVAVAEKPRENRPRRTRRREPEVIGELRVIEPAERVGMAYSLGRELTLGRAPGCGVVLDDTYISQLHCRLFERDGSYLVEDLGSRNGTFHNGNPLVSPTVLHPGDRVQVGSTIMEFS